MEGSTIDLERERGKVEDGIEVNVDIGTSRCGITGSSRVGEGAKIALDQRLTVGGLSGGRIHGGSTDISQDGRVEAASEAGRAEVGKCTDPVVPDWSVCIEND